MALGSRFVKGDLEREVGSGCKGVTTLGLQVPSANARSQTQQLVIMCSAVDLLLLMRQQHDDDYSLWSQFVVAHKQSQNLLK